MRGFVPTFLFIDSATSMNEVEKILIVFIELLQARLDLAKWREENQFPGVN